VKTQVIILILIIEELFRGLHDASPYIYGTLGILVRPMGRGWGPWQPPLRLSLQSRRVLGVCAIIEFWLSPRGEQLSHRKYTGTAGFYLLVSAYRNPMKHKRLALPWEYWHDALLVICLVDVLLFRVDYFAIHVAAKLLWRPGLLRDLHRS